MYIISNFCLHTLLNIYVKKNFYFCQFIFFFLIKYVGNLSWRVFYCIQSNWKFSSNTKVENFPTKIF
jgi:hypothetical protein